MNKNFIFFAMALVVLMLQNTGFCKEKRIDNIALEKHLGAEGEKTISYCLHVVSEFGSASYEVKQRHKALMEKCMNQVSNMNYAILFARNELAKWYLSGDVFEVNVERAIHLLEANAKNEELESTERLIEIYTQGDGGHKDCRKGLDYIERLKSSEKHKFEGIRIEAGLYESGLCLERDVNKAASLYLSVPRGECERCDARLAEMYRDGVGVTKNPNKAFEMFSRLAHHGFDDSSGVAFYSLAKMVNEGYFGKDQNTEIYKDLLIKAKDKNNLDARYEYAVSFGTMADLEAVADAGHALAQRDMAIYYRGEGVCDKAKFYALAASRKGLVDAQLLVGDMYLDGCNSSSNYKKAYTWLLVASKTGKDTADKHLNFQFLSEILNSKTINTAQREADRLSLVYHK